MSLIKRVGVLTSCTGAKLATAAPVRAEQLYRGQHHLRLMRGVDEARAAGVSVAVSIVSAGHGIVDGRHELRPYERTFQGRPARARRALARELGVPGAARAVLARPADLHVVLLGDDYLRACEFASDLAPSAPVLVFCAAGTALELPPMRHMHVVALTTEDTRRFRCGLVGLKGEVGGRLLSHLAATRPSVETLLRPGLLAKLSATGELATTATLF